jgi:hypothetical protein
MSIKEMAILTILISLTIFFGITVIKSKITKNVKENRIIEYIDPDYDKKYLKRN